MIWNKCVYFNSAPLNIILLLLMLNAVTTNEGRYQEERFLILISCSFCT